MHLRMMQFGKETMYSFLKILFLSSFSKLHEILNVSHWIFLKVYYSLQKKTFMKSIQIYVLFSFTNSFLLLFKFDIILFIFKWSSYKKVIIKGHGQGFRQMFFIYVQCVSNAFLMIKTCVSVLELQVGYDYKSLQYLL